MEYNSGKIGRVFYVRFDHGEDIFDGLKKLVMKENLLGSWFQIFGGVASANVVIGPKEPIMPPDPVWQHVDNVNEILGTGSIFWNEDEPLIHLHAALGHHGESVIGCVRQNAAVYLVIEAVVFELVDMQISRPWYEKGGFNRPEIKE